MRFNYSLLSGQVSYTRAPATHVLLPIIYLPFHSSCQIRLHVLAPAGPPLEKRVQKYILSQKYILRLEVHFLDTQKYNCNEHFVNRTSTNTPFQNLLKANLQLSSDFLTFLLLLTTKCEMNTEQNEVWNGYFLYNKGFPDPKELQELISQKARAFEVESCPQSNLKCTCVFGILNSSLNYQIKQMEVDWSLRRVACTVRLNVSMMLKGQLFNWNML